MTQQDLDIAPRRFSLGGVVGAGLPLLRRNFWQFFAVACIAGIPLVVLSLLLAQFTPPPIPPSGTAGPEMPLVAPSPTEAALSMAVGFIAILTYFVVQAAINFGALQDLRGARPTAVRCLSRALVVLPRVFTASLLLFLGIVALTVVAALLAYGMAVAVAASSGQGVSVRTVSALVGLGVLVVGMFLSVTWWVFVPAIVVENAGPVASFGRSRRLTKGHRWSILGIMLLVLLANLGCSIVVGLVGHVGAVLTAMLLNIVVMLAFFALSAVLNAVGYYALRAEKEGFGRADLARIFD
jgi:uncharacterized membrane protein YhaH (DUF805 family)